MPNAVKSPVINVTAGGPGGPSAAPRVAASPQPAVKSDHSAHPLQAAMPSAPGHMITHNGMLMRPEEAQMAAQAEAEAQLASQEALAKLDKGKPAQSNPSSVDIWGTQMLDSWSNRLAKMSSDPGFGVSRKFPGGTSRYDWAEKGGVVGGIPAMRPTYNPFKPSTTANKIYGFAKQMLTARLKNVKPKHWVDDDFRGETTPYLQHFARGLAEPVATGSTTNPLLVLGSNLFRSMAQGRGIPEGDISSALDAAGKAIGSP